MDKDASHLVCPFYSTRMSVCESCGALNGRPLEVQDKFVLLTSEGGGM